jgi:hypothetical protein
MESTLESRLRKLAALANDRCNRHEAALAAQRATEIQARALLAYARAVQATLVTEICERYLAGELDAAGAVQSTFGGVMGHPQGRRALLEVQP